MPTQTTKPTRRPNLHRTGSTSRDCYNDNFIEKMAQQTAFYITAFDEHAIVVRSTGKEQVKEAYNRIIEQGLMLPANSTPRTTPSMQLEDQECMEKKLRSLPRDTLDEYVLSYFMRKLTNIHQLCSYRTHCPCTSVISTGDDAEVAVRCHE